MICIDEYSECRTYDWIMKRLIKRVLTILFMAIDMHRWSAECKNKWIFNVVYCLLARFCPGSAPVRCHPATGTPQWGSAEVYFFSWSLLYSLFSSYCLFVFVFAALPNLSWMPTVPAQTRTSSYEEVNSLGFSNSRFRSLTFSSLHTSCQMSRVTLKRPSVSVRAH